MMRRLTLSACALLSVWLAPSALAENNRASRVHLIITDSICSGGTENGNDCLVNEGAGGECVVGGGTCGANARTTNAATGWFTTPRSARGVFLVADVTARAGDETADMNLQVPAIKQATGQTSFVGDCPSAGGMNAVGLFTCMVYPGISTSDTAGGAKNSTLPTRWRLNVVHAGTGSLTYNVEMHWLY